MEAYFLRLRYMLSILLLNLVIIAGGWFVVNVLDNYETENRRELFRQRAGSFALALNAEKISSLKDAGLNKTNPDYIFVKEQLKGILKINTDCRSCYLMRVRSDGKIMFISDADLSSPDDDAQPGEVYNDAPAGLAKSLLENKPFIIGPYVDKWGEWVSAIAPVYAKNTGNPVAYFGVDIDDKKWSGKIIVFKFLITCILGVLILSVIALLVTKKIVTNLVKEVSYSKNYFKTMFNDANEPLIIFEPESHCVFEVNKAFSNLLGYKQEEIVKLSLDNILIPVLKKNIQEDIDRFRTNNIVWATNQCVKKSDNTTVDVEIVGTKITLQGEECVIAVVRRTNGEFSDIVI